MIEAILNRWRGTGVIFTSIPFLKGTQIYAIYLAVIIGLFSTWYYGLIAGLLFVAGESFGWGKWVGYLTSYDGRQKPDYDDLEGYNFPYIHKTAELFVKERDNYKGYCETALAIRGFWWWMPFYIFLCIIGLINIYVAVLAIIILSVSFPIACYLGCKLKTEYKSKYLYLSRGWENQELVYGLIQGVVLWLCLILS